LTDLQTAALPLGYARLKLMTNAGEGNRTLEASLEDSNVADYITPAVELKGRCGTRTRSLVVRSDALSFPFELTARVLSEE
jgi:hypothetical protein